jgi:mRNA interferase MazF
VTRLVPDRGHVVVVDFISQSGVEQAGRRPALVLSPSTYNEKSGLCLCCPITSKTKGYPFEVPLPRTTETTGVILADHLRSLDWVARRAKIIGRVEQRIVEQVFQKLEPLLH